MIARHQELYDRMSDENKARHCPHCLYLASHARTAPPFISHDADCPVIDLESARHHLSTRRRSIEHERNSAGKARELMTYWEGRFHVLRHENNKLRKKLFPGKS